MIQHRTVHKGILASSLSGAIYLFLALIVGLALTPQWLLSQTRQTSAEKGTITLTTAKAIGETILLAIDGEGDITIDGVEEALQMGQFPSRRYTLTQQTVTICGDVTFLRANSVKLTSIILDKCDKLTELYCLGNELTALDLAGCPNLQTLWCNNNKLTSLDVSKSPKLEGLWCYNNLITDLNLSNSHNLSILQCYWNSLETLDLSKCTKLQHLECHHSKLSILDLSSCVEIEKILCDNNQLTSITLLAENPKLKVVTCHDNKLQKLVIGHAPSLEGIYCYNNQITEIGFHDTPLLMTVVFHNNQIKGEKMTQFVQRLPDRTNEYSPGTFIVHATPETRPQEGNVCFKSDVALAQPKNWQAYYYGEGYDYIPYEGEDNTSSTPTITMTTTANVGDYIMLSVDAEGEPEVEGAELKFGGMAVVKAPQITIRGHVTGLDCSEAQLTELNVSQMPTLTKLWCNNNALTALDTRTLADLEILQCIGNQLTELDITANKKLLELDCSENKLTQIDLSSCEKLTLFLAYHNAIGQIDLSHNAELIGIDLSENQLSALSVAANPKLETIYCNGNELSAISLEGNKELVSLSLLGNKLSSVDLSSCPNLEDVSLGYNQLSALDIRSNPKLYWIIIYKNNFSQEAVKSLFESLPTRPDKDGQIKILESRDDEVPEGNKFNSADIVIATQKGWRVMDGTGEIPSGLSTLSREGEAVQLYKSESGLTVMAPFPCLIYSIEGVCLGQTKVPEDQLTRGEYPSVLLLKTPQGAVHKLLL